MTLFDIAVVVVAAVIGVWGAFWLVALGKRIAEMGGPIAWYNEFCFNVWYWRLRSNRAAEYRSRHSEPSYMRHWYLL